MEATLILRLQSQQKTALSKAAAREGLKPSAFVRKLLAAHLAERQSVDFPVQPCAAA
jgi:uncharacterized protein (DUF1778 family)